MITPSKTILVAVLAGGFCMVSVRAGAQLSPQQPDPLARIREAAAATPVCSVSEASACAAAAPKIIANALSASPLGENLRHLTDQIGGRLTGSPAMARAVEWGIAAFRDAGVDEVHTEKYTVPTTWAEGNSELQVLSPVPFTAHIASVAWSPATPAAGIEADVVDAGMGTEEDFSRIGSAARGSILLVHTDLLRSRADMAAEYVRAPGIVKRAAAAGAVGLLWMGDREGMPLYRKFSETNGTSDRLPQAVLAREDAERLARDLRASHNVRVRLTMPNRIGAPTEQQNIVAEIRGREKPDEFVMIAAHLDSADVGTGALDDGCNAALVIEAARDIHLTGLRPRRSIRFVLFSGNEEGHLGAQAYVRDHRSELGYITAMIDFEQGSGRLMGFSLDGRTDVEPELRQALAPIESWQIDSSQIDSLDVARHRPEVSVHTDAFAFLLEGVPNLVADEDSSSYLPYDPAASNTYDKVNLLNLKLNTAIAGIVSFSLAEFAQPLGRRLSREEVETLLQKSGLEQPMKDSGIWPDFETRR